MKQGNLLLHLFETVQRWSMGFFYVSSRYGDEQRFQKKEKEKKNSENFCGEFSFGKVTSPIRSQALLYHYGYIKENI